MEKKPTLEEVKEYFKNADKIECLSYGKEISLLSKLRRGIHLWCSEYWVDLDPMDNAKLWDYNKGFAKILTYKEKTFTITESQVRELIEVTGFESKTNNKLKDLFPDLFQDKTKLKESLWYKSLDYPKWMLCVTNISFKEKRIKGYGFGVNGEWMDNAQNDSWEFYELDRCVEMSESEVFEALKNEAVKRGYKKGNHKCLNSPIVETHLENVYDFENGKLWYGGKYANCVFVDGQWSEIIPTITKSEAEKQLNKKIID